MLPWLRGEVPFRRLGRGWTNFLSTSAGENGPGSSAVDYRFRPKITDGRLLPGKWKLSNNTCQPLRRYRRIAAVSTCRVDSTAVRWGSTSSSAS